MAPWQFLRRMLNFVGGRIMGRLAPRLLFFQYTSKVTQEFDQKNRKYRFYQIRTAAQMQILRLKLKQYKIPDVGLSTVKDHSYDTRTEASIFDVHNHDDLSDTRTVYSTYIQDDRETFQFIQLDRSIVEDV